MTVERITKLRAKMAEHELDAFLVGCAVEDTFHIAGANRRYLSGFSGSVGWLAITCDAALIAVDFRYFEQATEESPHFTVFPVAGAMETWFGRLVGETGLSSKRIGFEAGDVSVAALNSMRKAVDALPEGDRPQLLAAPALITELRTYKDDIELDALQRAVDLGDAALVHVSQRMEPGWTEKKVAWEIEMYAREHGAEFMSFPTIVAAGPRGAMPHAQPTDAVIKKGDPVVIDMGVIVDGYCSDLTRTVVCGDKPSGKFREVYEIVLTAQRTAEEILKTGMGGEEGHMLAHNVIAEAGYGEHFGHGLGHGVGLQVHEPPYLGRTSKSVMENRMIVTVEPGIYLPGEFGVRIEDQCVFEGGKLRVMSKAPK
ncbi:MAG: aminopeptidase P family protein [Chloroflexota bacterium]